MSDRRSDSGAGSIRPRDERLFRQQVEAYLDDALSEDGCAVLDAMIRDEPALRAVFVEICLQDQISHRLLAPAPDVVLLATDDLEAQSNEEPDAGNAVMATLIEDALRARRLQEVEERAQRELDASRSKELQLAQRRASAIRAERNPQRWQAPAWAVWGSLAAALFFAVWVGIALNSSSPQPNHHTDSFARPTNPLEQAGTVAYVRTSIDARWGSEVDRELTFKAGQPITLEAGLVEVEFRNGTTVILQGPVSIEPTGPRGLRLVSGRLSASTPESSDGFRVDTPDMVVSNQQADFGVYVHPRTGTQAVAFAGELTVDTRELSSTVNGSLTRVLPGSGATAQAGSVRVVRADASAFVRHEEYTVRAAAVEGDAYSRWLAYSYELRRDPGVIAYYTFDRADESSHELQNRAVRTAGEFDGTLGMDDNALTRPQWVTGRFAQKGALRFGVVDQMRARTVVVKDFGGRSLGDTLTIALWVRTPESHFSAGGGTLVSLRDAPVRHMTFQFSLFLGGDPYPNQMQFGTGNELSADEIGDNFSYSSPRSVTSDDWHLAVVVYDPTGTTFYLDGMQVGRSPASGPLAVTRPSTALLLGTDPYMPNFDNTSRVEAFQGDIDELVILDRAMTRQEINAMYQTGLPD